MVQHMQLSVGGHGCLQDFVLTRFAMLDLYATSISGMSIVV